MMVVRWLLGWAVSLGLRGWSRCRLGLRVEDLVDGDGFVAAGAEASDADAGHERGALVAALFAESAGAAGVAFVDGAGFALTAWG